MLSQDLKTRKRRNDTEGMATGTITRKTRCEKLPYVLSDLPRESLPLFLPRQSGLMHATSCDNLSRQCMIGEEGAWISRLC